MLANLEGFRPFPRAMQDGQNVNCVIQDAIGDKVGRSRYNHFPRATDAAQSAGIGHAGSLPDCVANALDGADGRPGVVGGHILEDFPEMIDGRKGPSQFHDLDRAFFSILAGLFLTHEVIRSPSSWSSIVSPFFDARSPSLTMATKRRCWSR